jgi:hypothetical protein
MVHLPCLHCRVGRPCPPQAPLNPASPCAHPSDPTASCFSQPKQPAPYPVTARSTRSFPVAIGSGCPEAKHDAPPSPPSFPQSNLQSVDVNPCAPHHPNTSSKSPCSQATPDLTSSMSDPSPLTSVATESGLPTVGSTLSLLVIEHSRSVLPQGCRHPTDEGVPEVPHTGQPDGSHVLLHGAPPCICLLTPQIQLHIGINVVSRLNATEEERSLSVEEHSLREFLLGQIFSCRRLLSHGWHYTSSRSFLVRSGSMPPCPPWTRKTQVLNLMMWVAR